eukprot:TRINITY_DN63860_c0_g1_i1.p1 TRINITY_DN63860_c0_g1~~TRINITY_DN63860_c0_g1_i1.p1  ORF type:complete len:1121 (+),score=112.26 TRINITY_DN63860_c0_g1_i1:29-3364(+)
MNSLLSLSCLVWLIGTVLSQTATKPPYKWEFKPQLQPSRAAIDAAAGTINNKLYMIGGNDGSSVLSGNNLVIEHDPTGLGWTAVSHANSGSAPCPWSSNEKHTAATLDTDAGERIVVMGGLSNRVCTFDGTTWADAGITVGTQAFQWMASTTTKDGIFFSGGRHPSSGSAFGNYKRITISGSTWSVTTPGVAATIPYKRYLHGMVTGASGKLYTLFGTRDGTTCENTVYMKADPTSSANFVTLPAYSGNGRCGAAIGFVNGFIVVLGGSETPFGTPQKEMLMFDSENDVWLDPTDADAPHDDLTYGHARAPFGLVTGRVMVLGGFDGTSASKVVEFTDQPAVLDRCWETAVWDGTPAVIDDGFIDLPFKTFGFQFTAQIMSGGCVGKCVILHKGNCDNNAGGFLFNIEDNQWKIHLGRTKGNRAFSGLDDVASGRSYQVALEMTPPDTWKLTIKDFAGEKTGYVVGEGVGDLELPMHSVSLGGTTGCPDDTFLGSLTNVAVGSCTNIKVLETSPGYGSYGVASDTSIGFTLTNPGGLTTNGALVTPVYLRISDGTTEQTLGSDMIAAYISSGKIEITPGTDIFSGEDTMTYKIYNTASGPAGTTFTLEPEKKYDITIDGGFLAYDGGTFTGISSGKWTFGTKFANYKNTEREKCDSAAMILNMMPEDWDDNAWCSAMTKAFQNIPCHQIEIPLGGRRGHGMYAVEVNFDLWAVTGACDSLWAEFQLLINSGTLNNYMLYYGLGTIPRGTFHWGSLVKKIPGSEMIWRKPFEVYNTPDECSGPTDITMDLVVDAKMPSGYILPTNGVMIITFPYDFQMTSANDLQMTVCPVPCVSPYPKTYTASALINTEVTFNVDNTAPLGSMTITIQGATMPSSCDELNSWVWTVKTFDSLGTTLHAWIMKFSHRDTCHGVSRLVFGDPHFQSFSGGSYDVNGKANFFYNIITDKHFMWNARFISLNPRGHGTMHTYLGESAFLINGTRVYCDPTKWQLFVDGKQVWTTDERIRLAANSPYYVKLTANIMYIRAPGFFIALKHVLKEHGKALPHFDHVVTLTEDNEGRVRPHGLLGQTVHFKKPVVSHGHQGEGVIEGKVVDYEVPTLWSHRWKFNQYEH